MFKKGLTAITTGIVYKKGLTAITTGIVYKKGLDQKKTKSFSKYNPCS